MTKVDKTTVKNKLIEKINLLGITKGDAAKQIGVNLSDVNNIINENWAIDKRMNLSVNVWDRVANWIENSKKWQIAETEDFRRIFNICHHARTESLSLSFVSAPGSGKTFALKEFTRKYNNVYYISCSEHLTKKAFLKKLKTALGLGKTTSSIPDMVDQCVEFLNTCIAPLVILDEVDKLTDSVFYLFHTLYNETEYKAGFILSGTNYLKSRIEKGVRLGKKGYEEIYSRIGGEFLYLNGISEKSIKEVCNSNGVYNHEDFVFIKNRGGDDLRKVKVAIEKLRLKRQKVTQ